jgi:hypothetical protein
VAAIVALLLAIAASGAIGGCAAGSPPGGQTQSEEEVPQGRPLSHPLGKPKTAPPETPPGITAVTVPTELEEGEAEYVSKPPPGGVEFRPAEVPVSLHAMQSPPASSWNLATIDFAHTGAHGGDLSIVAAGSSVAEGPACRAELREQRLVCASLEGAREYVLPMADALAGPGSAVNLRQMTLAYDEVAARYIVAALGPALSGVPGAAGDAEHVLLAVSDDPEPEGAWHVARIELPVAAAGVSKEQQFLGLVIDTSGIHAVFTEVNGGPRQTRRRAWIIRRGLETSGFYLGGIAIIGVY